MIPEYPRFKALELTDREAIELSFGRKSPLTCELTSANLFIWRDFDRPQLTLINDNICCLINPLVHYPYFLEPFGDNKVLETTELCLKHIGIISRVSMSYVGSIPHRQYKISCLRDQADYIYVTKELAELKGRRYDGKRNHLNNFKRRHPDYSFVPLEPTDQPRALAVFEKWFEERKDTQYFSKLAYAAQKKALERAFEDYRELALVGGALLIGGEMKAFIMASRLNPEMISAHFQYVEPNYRGITQTILWEACNRIFSGYKYLDLEQDLGIPGLRKAKLSYQPHKLEKKFEIVAKELK